MEINAVVQKKCDFCVARITAKNLFYPVIFRENGSNDAQLSVSVSAVVSCSGRRRPALEDVTMSVRAGEILGVAGVEGNGQKELAEAVVGIRRRRVRRPAPGRPPRSAVSLPARSRRACRRHRRN